MAVVRAAFKPEFLNRLDDVVVFDALGTRGAGPDRRPAGRPRWRSRLADRRLTLEVTDGGPRVAGRAPATTRSYGARPLRRLVQTAIGDRLAKALLAGEVRDGATVQVDVDAAQETLHARLEQLGIPAELTGGRDVVVAVVREPRPRPASPRARGRPRSRGAQRHTPAGPAWRHRSRRC